MSKRTLEYDFTKGVLIALMIFFHLDHFTDTYPQLYKWIFAFHMPGFLILSGYFFNFRKEPKEFLKSLRGIVIPYVVFMTLYFISLNFLGDILGTTHRFELNSFTVLLKRVILAPTGTYWYLHTLAVCMVLTYFTNKLVKYFKIGGGLR